MRFHVLSLPHTVTRSDYSACAFTMKVLKFCKMMTRRGHTVFHYGHADSTVECTEHIPVTDNEILKAAYGDHDWRKNLFVHNTADYANMKFNENAIREVGKRKEGGDFLLAFWGLGHVPIIETYPDMIAVEPGIGCFNKPCTKFSVYESYSVMNGVYGKYEMMPRWYDAVIPNYFDKDDFTFNAEPHNYFLYVGRIVEPKGVGIAIEVTKLLRTRLVIAGQGSIHDIVKDVPDHVTLVGYVEPPQRNELMRNALALLAPSHYSEPFGGVTIEALLCGTPIITSDWGAFPETNLHGITGYRCRTIEQFVWAARNIGKISRHSCHTWAVSNYSLERVALMYEEYFQGLTKIYDGSNGFYARNDSRKELDWLSKAFPWDDKIKDESAKKRVRWE